MEEKEGKKEEIEQKVFTLSDEKARLAVLAGDVGEALKDTTGIVEQITDATKEQTEAANDNIKILKEQDGHIVYILEERPQHLFHQGNIHTLPLS